MIMYNHTNEKIQGSVIDNGWLSNLKVANLYFSSHHYKKCLQDLVNVSQSCKAGIL